MSLREELIDTQRKFIAEQDRRIKLLEAENTELLALIPIEMRPLSASQKLMKDFATSLKSKIKGN